MWLCTIIGRVCFCTCNLRQIPRSWDRSIVVHDESSKTEVVHRRATNSHKARRSTIQIFLLGVQRYQDDLKQFWTTKIRVFLFSEASVDFLPGPLNDFLVGNVRIHALCRVTSPVWLTGRAALCQLVFSYSCCTRLMTQPFRPFVNCA